MIAQKTKGLKIAETFLATEANAQEKRRKRKKKKKKKRGGGGIGIQCYLSPYIIFEVLCIFVDLVKQCQ